MHTDSQGDTHTCRLCLHCTRSPGSDSGLNPGPLSAHTPISLTWGQQKLRTWVLGPCWGLGQSPKPAGTWVQALPLCSVNAVQAALPHQRGWVMQCGHVSMAGRPGSKPRFTMQCGHSSAGSGTESTSPGPQRPGLTMPCRHTPSPSEALQTLTAWRAELGRYHCVCLRVLCTCVYLHVSAHVYISVCVWVHVCEYVCVCIFVSFCVCLCV